MLGNRFALLIDDHLMRKRQISTICRKADRDPDWIVAPEGQCTGWIWKIGHESAPPAPSYCCHCEHCAALLCLSKKGIPEFSLFNFTDLITVGIRAKQLHPTAANEARRDLLLRLAALRAKSSLRLKHQLMCLSGNGTLWFASTKIRSLLPI